MLSNRIRTVMVLALFASVVVLSAQNHAAFAKMYEDAIFKTWYMHWRPGAVSVEPYRHHGAAVAVFIEGGTLRLPSGVTQVRNAGDVVYYDPDSIANAGELISSTSARALIVELATLPTSPAPALVGIAPAFPRANMNIVLENAAVRAWDLQYRPDQPLQPQVYLKHTVQVWLTEAVIERVHPNEPPRRDARSRGAFEVLHAGYVMSEHVLGGPAHVIAIERK
jgi:hypothetical protein